jgi:exosome complex RNA-binding protein Rrp42 (RNase PH superfamily)
MQARALEEEGTTLACQLQQMLLTRDKTGSGLDLKALSVIPGVACWALFIDCIVLYHGGIVLTALSAAIHKALQSTTIPKISVDSSIEDATVEDIDVDANVFARQKIDATNLPVLVTVCQVCSFLFEVR